MIWLNPIALAGVAAVVAPILIHILVQRRAPSFPFPTLRFLQPTRLAAIRRHVLEDLPLVLVRAAILAVAAAALAGPFLVTPTRRAEWNSRIARAIVGGREPGGPERAAPRLPDTLPLSGPPAAFQTAVETSDLHDGIARAVAWLESSPPARRELVVAAPFALGSLTRADLADVPPDVGIRLVRSGQLAATRSFAASPVLDAEASRLGVRRRDRTIELSGPSTSVREASPVAATVPIEIAAPAEVKRAAEATLAAVLSQRVPAPVPGRTARIVFDNVAAPSSSAKAVPPRLAERASADQPKPLAKAGAPTGGLAPWLADAVATLTTADVQLSTVSADADTLVVTTSLPPTDFRTALLFHSLFDALSRDSRSAKASASARATADNLADREVLAIPDADLRAWERPPRDVGSLRLDTIAHDDRRWWWGAVLALLAVEGWLRRSRRETVEQAGEVEAARVA